MWKKKYPLGKGWELLSTAWALVQGRRESLPSLHPSTDQMDQTIHGLGLEEESRTSPGAQQQLLERAPGNPETKEALGFENKRTERGQAQSHGEL